jgi:hypothetical protein
MSNIIENNTDPQYQTLVSDISSAFEQGQAKTIQAINTGLVATYWQIGQQIVEFEQQGNVNAEYGKNLLSNLSKDLKLIHGRGIQCQQLTTLSPAVYPKYKLCDAVAQFDVVASC